MSHKSAKISPARAAAFKILREISASAQAHSDDLLQGPATAGLSSQDSHLATALVMGTLRWQTAFQAPLGDLLAHKTKLDEPVRIALHVAMFQLLFMDRVPAHAAITESVEWTKRAGYRSASGLVNAVLRKVAAQANLVRTELQSEAAHPAWLRERWRSAYGQDAAAAICGYDQQPPAMVLRVVTLEADTQLAADGIVSGAGELLTSARRVLSGHVTQSAAMRTGAVRAQDEGSQLVAELLGGPERVESILDCCAAPGGKTAILAERYPQARVVAWDISQRRLEAMQARFAASPVLARVECRVQDVTQQATQPDGAKKFDLILCDVPCSGTGTLARNPEIRHRLKVEDLARQQERQVAILRSALHCLAPGGRLLYSTCSLEAEENEQVIARVVAECSSVRLMPMAERIAQLQASGVLQARSAELLLEEAVRGSFLRTIPGRLPCDGFFAALLAAC